MALAPAWVTRRPKHDRSRPSQAMTRPSRRRRSAEFPVISGLSQPQLPFDTFPYAVVGAPTVSSPPPIRPASYPQFVARLCIVIVQPASLAQFAGQPIQALLQNPHAFGPTLLGFDLVKRPENVFQPLNNGFIGEHLALALPQFLQRQVPRYRPQPGGKTPFFSKVASFFRTRQ